jgi:hypothetical protein
VINVINWGAVITGFLLSIILGAIFGVIIPVWGSLIGLLIAGMAAGYMAGGDTVNGMVNGALAGLFGGIILSIMLIIFGTILLGLVGFAVATLSAIVIMALFVGAMIIMAVGGALGAVVRGEPYPIDQY